MADVADVSKPWRAWVAMFALPFVLVLVFGCFAAFLVFARGVATADLPREIEAASAYPVTVAFSLALYVTLRFARADGLSPAALGWTRPAWHDLAIGAGLAVPLHLLNVHVLYPLVQRFQAFDPTVPSVSLVAAVVSLTVAATSEDTLYRGFALVALRRRHGVAVSIVATSLVYALVTPGPDWALKVWAAYFGAVLAAIRLWRGNLWPVVVVHALVALGPKLLASV